MEPRLTDTEVSIQTQLSALIEISSIPTSMISVYELGRIVLDKATRVLGVSNAFLYRVDDNNEIMFWSSRGINRELASRTKLPEKVVRTIVDSKQLLYLKESSLEMLENFLPNKYSFKHALIVPLKVDKQVWGYLVSLRITDNPFLEYHFQLFMALGERCATALRTISLVNALEKKTSELKMSNTDLERYASLVSHDLRVPISIILHYLEKMQNEEKGNLNESTSEFLRMAIQSSRRMNNLIEGLLEFSKFSKVPAQKGPVNTEDIVKQIEREYRVLHPDSRATFNICTLPVLLGDEMQLIQVFTNLIGNGIKYQDKTVPKIEVFSEELSESWKIYIRDNGIGISEKSVKTIFNIFERAHTAKDFEGTGIGLAIVKRIIENNSGDIEVFSKPGVGTTMVVTWPK